jgi:hypothetical protein
VRCKCQKCARHGGLQCGAEISTARLEAVPGTLWCLACADAHLNPIRAKDVKMSSFTYKEPGSLGRGDPRKKAVRRKKGDK